MELDSSVISTLLIAAASLLGWLYTKATAQSKAARQELRWRRKKNAYDDRYIFRLERKLDTAGIDYPDQPEGRLEHIEEEW